MAQVRASLMLAAGKQRREDAQVRMGKEPAFRRASSGSCSAHDRAKVLTAGNRKQMLGADSRQAGNFVIGESFLSGFDGDHYLSSFAIPSVVSLCRKKPGNTPLFFKQSFCRLLRSTLAALCEFTSSLNLKV
jgi:hypothetical protein